MTDFTTKVAGIPCVCRVTHYRPEIPDSGMNGRYEDAEMGAGMEFNFELHKVKGNGRMQFLEAKVTDDDIDRLAAEYELHVTAIKHLMDDF